MILQLIAICLFLIENGMSQNYNGAKVDRGNWVDPSDMLNFDMSTGKMKNIHKKEENTESTPPLDARIDKGQDNEMNAGKLELDLENNANAENTEPKLQKSLDSCSKNKQILQRSLEECEEQMDMKPASQVPYMKQYIRGILDKMADAESHIMMTDSVAYTLTVVLSNDEFSTLQSFVDTNNGNMQDAHRVLVDMLKEVHLHPDYRPETWSSWLSDVVNIHLLTVLQLSGVFALCSLGICAQIQLNISWRSLFFKLLVLLFVVSVPWNWWHLYKIEIAQRHAEAMKDMPSECTPQDQSMWQVITAAFSVHVDKCAKYHEQMMVDPMWEVAPTRAIAVTITKFCLEPLEYIGRALGKFIRAPLEELPVHMWPLALVFVIVVFVLVLIMSFGYKIKLFYLFGLEPDGSKHIKGVEYLHKSIEALTAKVEAISGNSNRITYEETEVMVERRIQALMGPPLTSNLENIGAAGIDYVDSRQVSRQSFLREKRPAIQSSGVPSHILSQESRKDLRETKSDIVLQQSYHPSNREIHPEIETETVGQHFKDDNKELDSNNFKDKDQVKQDSYVCTKEENPSVKGKSDTQLSNIKHSFQVGVEIKAQEGMTAEDYVRDTDCCEENTNLVETVKTYESGDAAEDNQITPVVTALKVKGHSEKSILPVQELGFTVEAPNTIMVSALQEKLSQTDSVESLSASSSISSGILSSVSDNKDADNHSNREECNSAGSCDKESDNVSNAESFEVIAESDSEESEEKLLKYVGFENLGSLK